MSPWVALAHHRGRAVDGAVVDHPHLGPVLLDVALERAETGVEKLAGVPRHYGDRDLGHGPARVKRMLPRGAPGQAGKNFLSTPKVAAPTCR